MARIALILALLASLAYMVRYLQPAPEPKPAKVAAGRSAPAVAEPAAEGTGGFYPAVPEALPDINKGYVFSEKRQIEKDEPPAAQAALVDPGPDLLASLVYSGSVISGNLRRALVVYQDQPAAAVGRRAGGGRGQQPGAQGPFQNKQLNQGDRFLGYVVAAIEPDRIVFEKGDRKVEKFLYDRGKNRFKPAEAGRSDAAAPEPGGVPMQAVAPPEVLEAMMNPPAAAPATPPPSRVIRRSQRLLGLDPSIKVPATPVPGRPVPNK